MPPRKKQAPTRKTKDDVNSMIVVSGLWRIGAIAGGALAAVYAAYIAWNGLGWWVPAGITYVDSHIDSAIRPIVTKVDDQGISITNGRLDILKGQRQQQTDAKSRLELQSHITKDPIALQLIQSQQKGIDETIKAIDDQIATLSAELKTAQTKGK